MNRNLRARLAVLAGSALLLLGVSSALGAAPAAAQSGKTCVVHSLPSFIAQGENVGGVETASTVADIVEVECDPTVYGTKSGVKITASQLFTRCDKRLTWYVPNNPPGVEGGETGGGEAGGFEEATGPGVSVRLDADGRAIVALLAGRNCMAGENIIAVHQEEEPFESFATAFTVLPPVPTPPGVFVTPSHQVEDSYSSAVATIIQVESTDGSEKFVHIGSEELYRRCREAPHLRWILMDRTKEEDKAEVTKVQLDNDGNAFVIVIGDSSCAPGASLIEADLENKPFTTYLSEFTVEPPRPTF
jgi:hypothetical protein